MHDQKSLTFLNLSNYLAQLFKFWPTLLFTKLSYPIINRVPLSSWTY